MPTPTCSPASGSCGRVWIVGPSIDASSPKNQELSPEAVDSILSVIGLQEGDRRNQAMFHRFDGSPARVDRGADLDQTSPVPREAPLVTQVSRWDRLKD